MAFQKRKWLKSNLQPPPLPQAHDFLFTLVYLIFIRLMAMSFNDRGYFYFISKYHLMKISKYNSGGGVGAFLAHFSYHSC